MDKIYENGNFTKDCMVTALLLLMEEKEYDKISISEITEKAGVSRMAYYRNYKDKDDILLDRYYRAADSISLEMTDFDIDALRNLIIETGMFFQKNIPVLSAIVKTGNVDKIFSKISEKIHHSFPVIRNNKKLEYTAHFYTGAFISTFKLWFENGMIESIEEIADIIVSLVDEDIFIHN